MWNIGSNGYQTANSTSLQGTMSNFRLVVGSAVYTSNFTVPSSKLTAITNTEMLTYQSNHFVDNSADGNVLTSISDPTVTAFGPILTDAVYDPAVNGASAFLDGSGDALSTPSMTINGTGNFTLELWTYMTSTGGNRTFATFNDAGGATNLLQFYVRNGEFKLYSDAGGVRTFSGYAAENQWSFVHLSRSGSTFTLKVNNVSRGTVSGSENLNGVLGIGAYVAGSIGDPYKGYMYNYRVSNNIRSSAIPTQPLGTDSNTKLLLNMADGQAIDSAAQNNLTLYGTAKTSTAQKKFNTASLLLDGNSDYAVFPHSGSNDIAGGGNWAVEFFFRIADRTVYQQLAGKGTGFQMYCGYADTKVGLAVGTNSTSAAYFVSAEGGTITNDTWHHLAAVKNGTSYKLFLDGTAVVSVTSSSNVVTGTQSWIVGAYKLNGGSASAYTNGYIDDFRVSKFARYTSNFTAPSEPFADKGQDA